MMSEKIIPHTVDMFNKGRFGNDYEVFIRKDFYRNVLCNKFSTNIAEEYLSALRVERGTCVGQPEWVIVSLTLPGGDRIKVGDARVIGIIVDKHIMKAVAYVMEESLKSCMCCQWDDGKHFNFGEVADRSVFFRRIISLAKDEMKELGNEALKRPYQADVKFPYKDKSIKPKQEEKGLWKRVRKLPWWIQVIVVIVAAPVVFFLVSIVILSVSSSNKYKNKEYSESHIDLNTESDIIADTVVREEEDYSDYLEEEEEYYESSSISTDQMVRHILNLPYPNISNNKGQYSEKKNDNAAGPVEIVNYSNGQMPYADWFGRGRYDKNSLSQLTIDNYSTADAVVLLADANDDVVRHSYIRRNSSYTIKGIPEGNYIMKVMMGNRWNSLKNNGRSLPKGGFMDNVSFSKSSWKDEFNFYPVYADEGIDYPTYSVTLHGVKNGNFQTSKSSSSDFFGD